MNASYSWILCSVEILAVRDERSGTYLASPFSLSKLKFWDLESYFQEIFAVLDEEEDIWLDYKCPFVNYLS